VTERKNGKWETPVNLGENVNSKEDEFYPSVGKTGNIYFTATREYGIGKEDIFVSRFENNKYSNAIPLDTNVNSTLYEFNAFVSPDESFIIFTAYGRKDDIGRGDLYISKKNANGGWEKAVNMGGQINSPFLDYCPFVSFDKKTFYFTSERTNTKLLYDKSKTFTDFNSFLNKPGNGNGDIYCIPFNF
jgi:WD40-like Beta Propeller Repeat